MGERRRIKRIEARVGEIVVETPDTVTLFLETGGEALDYRAGHFLTIDPHQFEELERFIAFFEDEKGKREPPRAYSLASAPDERRLSITIKEERYLSGVTRFPPLLSPLLVRRIARGADLVVTGFTGPYTIPDDIEARTDHLVHLCAGSGSVPNFSIVKHALAHFPALRHTWINSNKTFVDVIFRRELEDLAARHPDRLRLVHTLTREENVARFGASYRRGRVDASLLRELIPDSSSAIVYACGPAIGPWEKLAAREAGVDPTPRFLETCFAALAELGVPDDHIISESYG
jgi:ferredoxin-NADP reductase